MPADPSARLASDDLRARVEAREWYHTLAFRDGISTPGWFDTRSVAAGLPFPDLTGRRCLDVGTFDGFWAFELERRGAAEVLAVDVPDPEQWDWPVGSTEAVKAAVAARVGAGDGFVLAAAEYGSRVERRLISVYDLDPAVVGVFDFVYVGSLLLHLRDPVRAIQAVRSVVRTDGCALFVDAVDLELTIAHPRRPVAHLDGVGRPWWWKPNRAGLARMVEAGGFRIRRASRVLYLPPGRGQHVAAPPRRSLLRAPGRDQWVQAHRGDPHAWVRAEPR